MAKCAICEKTLSHGNKLSITRSHVSNRASRTWRPKQRSVSCKNYWIGLILCRNVNNIF